jgi:hypothetical protein
MRYREPLVIVLTAVPPEEPHPPPDTVRVPSSHWFRSNENGAIVEINYNRWCEIMLELGPGVRACSAMPLLFERLEIKIESNVE